MGESSVVNDKKKELKSRKYKFGNFGIYSSISSIWPFNLGRQITQDNCAFYSEIILLNEFVPLLLHKVYMPKQRARLKYVTFNNLQTCILFFSASSVTSKTVWYRIARIGRVYETNLSSVFTSRFSSRGRKAFFVGSEMQVRELHFVPVRFGSRLHYADEVTSEHMCNVEHFAPGTKLHCTR